MCASARPSASRSFEFQNTRFKLAEVARHHPGGLRAFVDRCVEQLVAGKLDTATASMAKLWGAEQQGKLLDECLQLFGGYGYMNEYMMGPHVCRRPGAAHLRRHQRDHERTPRWSMTSSWAA
jgi:alkylation response protein AidB-like acyl-CoA dehydrogenase